MMDKLYYQLVHGTDHAPKPSKLGWRDAAGMIVHAAGLVAAVAHTGVDKPVDVAVSAAIPAIICSSMMARSSILTRLYIILYSVSASLISSAHYKPFFMLGPLVSMMMHTKEIQINAAWIMLLGLNPIPLLSSLGAAGITSSSVGFDEEEEAVADINERLSNIEKVIENDNEIPDVDKPHNQKIVREVRYNVIGRNKIGAQNSLIKASQTMAAYNGGYQYDHIFQSVGDQIKTLNMHTKMQKTLSAVATMITGATVVGSTISATINNHNFTIFQHAPYIPTKHDDPKNPDNPTPRPAANTVPYSEFVKGSGGDQHIDHKGLETFANILLNYRQKWVNACESTAAASLKSKGYENIGNIGFDLIGAICNVSVQGKMDPQSPEYPLAHHSSHYKFTERPYLMKMVEDPLIPDNGREAAAGLLAACHYACEMSQHIAIEIVGSGGKPTLIAEGKKLAERLRSASGEVRGVGIPAPAKPHLNIVLQSMGNVMADVMTAATSDACSPHKLFHPPCCIKGTKDVVDTCVGLYSAGQESEFNAIKSLVDIGIRIQDTLGALETQGAGSSRNYYGHAVYADVDDLVS